jgi:uncharacterized membrane protein
MNSIDITNNIILNSDAGKVARPDRKSDSGKASTTNAADANMHAEYATSIRKALQADETDTQSVQQARQALISAQLDSMENIEQAAENILKFGI